MEDVARAAGVHQTTVSRVLRNDHRVTEPVKVRVREAAERLGYRPNPLLSALGTMRRQRASTHYATVIAYIQKGATQVAHLSGIRAAADQRGYKVDVFEIGPKLSASRLNDILRARGILGIVLGPLPEAHGHFTLDWDHFSTVAIEYSFTQPAFDRVVTNSYDTMNTVIRECRKRGYTRMGVALKQVVDERNEGLLCAAYALARERNPGMAPLPPLLLPQWDEKAFLAWFKREKPQVVISSNFLLPQIEECLAKLKRRVPDQVGLVNLNLNPEMQHYSGVYQDAPAIGAMAVRLVIDKLNHNDYGVPATRMTVLTDGFWFAGKTLKETSRTAMTEGA
jgi:LacI family transcriptional regulator/LacI family fructose operon transcriptional repressor